MVTLFPYFADKILKQMEVQDNESINEWQTPFHYLLCRLFSIATDWAEQCQYIRSVDIPQETIESDNFDGHYISKEATKVLGAMLEHVIPSMKLSKSTKVALLEIVVRCYIRIEENKILNDVASSLLKNSTMGDLNSTSASIVGNYKKYLIKWILTYKAALRSLNNILSKQFH